MSFDCHLNFNLEYPKSWHSPKENYRMSCDSAINFFKDIEANLGHELKISDYQISKSNGYSQITASSSKIKNLAQVRKDIDAFQKMEVHLNDGKYHLSDDGFGP